MAFRLGHQITCNLNKHLIFRNSSASARRYRSLSRGSESGICKGDVSPASTETETIQKRTSRARSQPRFSVSNASMRREYATESFSQPPQQQSQQSQQQQQKSEGIVKNVRKSTSYSLQPKHLPPMATTSIHLNNQFAPNEEMHDARPYESRLDEVQRQASVKYEQAVRTFNISCNRVATSAPSSSGYRYELDAAKPKVDKGTHVYNIVAAIKSREQSIAAQAPQLQPKNIRPYGDIMNKPWCTPLMERIKHKPLSISRLEEAIHKSILTKHTASNNPETLRERVTINCNQTSPVESVYESDNIQTSRAGGTLPSSQITNPPQITDPPRSGISASKPIDHSMRKAYSTSISGSSSDSEAAASINEKNDKLSLGKDIKPIVDKESKNASESTSLQLYRASDKFLETNFVPKKREMISAPMEEKRTIHQNHNLKNNEIPKNATSKIPQKNQMINLQNNQLNNVQNNQLNSIQINQLNNIKKNQSLSLGSALLERIMKISKENLVAVRNGMDTSVNANEIMETKAFINPPEEKPIPEPEPIKVKVGPKLKLQSTDSCTLEKYSDNEKSLTPQNGEKFTVPWLSWGDRVKIKKQEEVKSTGNLNLIPKSMGPSAKERSRSLSEIQMRRYSTGRSLDRGNEEYLSEKEIQMEEVLMLPVHTDFIAGIDLPENKHLLTKNITPRMNVRSYSTGIPDECICDPPPREKKPIPREPYCNIGKFPKTHVNPDCKKKCVSEYTVMVKLRRLPKVCLPDPIRICPEPCDDAIRADDGLKVCPKQLPKLIPKPCPPVPPPCMTDVPLKRLIPRPVKPFRPCPPPPCIDPRADDGMKVKPKKLPKLVPKMCGRCEEVIMTSPPLVRLIPREVYPPPPCKPPMCPEPPITRADDGLKVCPKQLPKLIAPCCPRICPDNLVDGPPLKRLKCACVYHERICPCEPTVRDPCCPPRADEICNYTVTKKLLPTMVLSERFNEISTADFNRMKRERERRHFSTYTKGDMCCYADKKIQLALEDIEKITKSTIEAEYEHQVEANNSQKATVQLFRKPIGDVKRRSEIPTQLLRGGYTGNSNGWLNESRTFGFAGTRLPVFPVGISRDLTSCTSDYQTPFSRQYKPKSHCRTYATQSLRVYTTGSSSIFRKMRDSKKRSTTARNHNKQHNDHHEDDHHDDKTCPKFAHCRLKKPPCCGPNPRGVDCSIKAPYPPCTAQQAPYPSFSECQKECCKRPRNECTEQDRIFERQKQTGQLDICNILKTPPKDFRHNPPKKDDPGCKGYSTLAGAHYARLAENVIPSSVTPSLTISNVQNQLAVTPRLTKSKPALIGSNDEKLQRIAYSVLSSDLQKLTDKDFKNFFLTASILAPSKSISSDMSGEVNLSYLADAVKRYSNTLTLPQLVDLTKKSSGLNSSIRFSDKLLGRKCMTGFRSYSTLQVRRFSQDCEQDKGPCKKVSPEGCCPPKARETCEVHRQYPSCSAAEAPYPSFSDCNKGFPRLPICECTEQEKVFIKMKNSGMFSMKPKKSDPNCGIKLHPCEKPHKFECDRKKFSTCMLLADPSAQFKPIDEVEETETDYATQEKYKTERLQKELDELLDRYKTQNM